MQPARYLSELLVIPDLPVAGDPIAVARDCDPTLATLRAPCEVFGTKTKLRRVTSGVRSGVSWRARVCLSKRDRTCRIESMVAATSEPD